MMLISPPLLVRPALRPSWPRKTGAFAVTVVLALSVFSPAAAQPASLFGGLGGDTLAWEALGDRAFPGISLHLDDRGLLWAGTGSVYRLDLPTHGPTGPWELVRQGPRYDYVLPLRATDDGAGGLRQDTVLAALTTTYRSLDGGATFVTVSPLGADEGLREVREGPLSGVILGANTDEHTVLASRDRGATWEGATWDVGTSFHPVLDAYALPSGTVIAGFLGGIARSDDGARSFHATSHQEGLRYGVRFVGHVERTPDDPAGPGVRALALGADSQLPYYRIYASDDDGRTWTDVRPLIDPEWNGPQGDGPAGLVHLGGSRALVVLMHGYMEATEDGGRTWAPAGRVPIERVVVGPGETPPDIRVGAVHLGWDGRLYVGLVTTGANQIGYVKRTVLPVVAVAAEPEAPERPSSGLAVVARPNPSRGGAVEVEVTLAAPGAVEVVAYDGLGRRVGAVHRGPLAAGAHRLSWAAEGLPAGVYVLRAEAGGAVASTRVTLVR